MDGERQLVEAARRGDARAYAALVRMHQRLKALSTPALGARIDERPEDYLRDNAGTVSFAQMTDVGIDENGLYLTFVRLSDTKVFSDSQYQENFAVEKSGDRYLVEYMETDA